MASPLRWATPATAVEFWKASVLMRILVRYASDGLDLEGTLSGGLAGGRSRRTRARLRRVPGKALVAQSVSHGHAVRLATAALDQRFRACADVLVAMELVVYHERGNNRAWLRPDVQVAISVKRGVPRSTFKVWEEGEAPNFVLEVASPSTLEN